MEARPPLRILIVENHTDTRETLVMLLQAYGHDVTGVATMREALERLAIDDWDVLLSDIGLPDGNGWELLSRARPHHPVYAIAMSGYGMNADRERSLAAGYRHHLVKPMALEQIERILDTLQPAGRQGG